MYQTGSRPHLDMKRLLSKKSLRLFLNLGVKVSLLPIPILGSRKITGWLKIFLVSYFFGSFLNHNLFLAIHELSHNLVFSTPVYNCWLGIFANLPIGVPMCIGSFYD